MKNIISILLVFLFLILPGCSPEVKENRFTLESVEVTTYPMIIKDDSKADVIIDHKPTRIISLLPSSTEILYSLDQEQNIVGISKWDNYPQGIQEKGFEVFDDALNPNLDKVMDLNPDLVLIGSVSGDTLRKMRSLQIPVVVVNPQSIENTYETIRKIGNITDSHTKSVQLIESMQKKEEKIKEIVSGVKEEEKKRVWLEVSPDLYTPGKNTFLYELITKAGGNSISSEIEGWGQYRTEQIIQKNPQVIFYTYGQFVENAQEQIRNRVGWQDIQAVNNNQIIGLDNDIISRPGPRIIDALEEIAKSLYPEKF